MTTLGAHPRSWHDALREPVPIVARPVEWWEWLLAARDAWRDAHPRLTRALSLCVLIVVWLAIPVMVVAIAVVPRLRDVLAMAVPCWWLAACWFLLARTKTISWTLYARVFVAAVPWAMVIGLFSLWLVPQAVGDARDVGASVGIAPVAEESLKLMPLLAIALFAPGRVRRFAVTDWLLLGFAAGLGFTMMEEMARRVAVSPWSLFGPGGGEFTLSPISGGQQDVVRDVTFAVAGHHIHTALVAVAIGLAVACWRHATRRAGVVGMVWRVVAVLVPVMVWWLAVTDHAGWNASAASYRDPTMDSGLGWTDDSRVAPVIVATWTTLGHGNGRGWLLLALLLVALLVDARAMHQAERGIPLVPGLAWTDPDVAVARLRPWTDRMIAGAVDVPAFFRVPLRAGVTLVETILALITYVVRDVVVIFVAHTRDPAPDQPVPPPTPGPVGKVAVVLEPVRAGMARGLVALMMIRAARLDALDTAAGPVRRLVHVRLLALLGMVLVLAAAWPLAVWWAGNIGDHLAKDGAWLAGLFDRMADWWNSLSGVEQFAVMAAIVALLVLAGASFTVGIWAAGALTFLMSQGHVLATFTRNPKQATLDYLTKTPPQKIGLDLLQWGLALSPGNRFRWFGRRGIREATERYAVDPDTWRRARAAAEQSAADPYRSPIIDEGKYDYLFGRVTSGPHNTSRSVQNLNELYRIGLRGASGREHLEEHLRSVAKGSDNIRFAYVDEYGMFEVRESLIAGPYGFAKLETGWQIMPDGRLRLTTMIPKGGKK